MIMRKLYILFLAGTFLLGASCKNSSAGSKDKEEITATFEKMNQHVIKEEYEKVVAFMHPDAFQTFTADEMAKGMRESMHTPDYDIIVRNILIDSISNVFPAKANKYALVKSHTQASFAMKIDSSQDQKTQDAMMNTYCSNMREGLGEKNVTCHIAEKTLDISMPDKTYFIYSGNDKKWFAVSGANETAINKLIPADIINKLGK